MDTEEEKAGVATFDEHVQDLLAKYREENSSDSADSDSDSDCSSSDSDSSRVTDSEDEEMVNATEQPRSHVLRWREARKEEEEARKRPQNTGSPSNTSEGKPLRCRKRRRGE